MATKAERIAQMQHAVTACNRALEQLQRATLAIARADPAVADATLNAIQAADEANRAAELNVEANLTAAYGDNDAFRNAEPAREANDDEKTQLKRLASEGKQVQQAVEAERARLAQVTIVGQQTQAFYNALGAVHPPLAHPLADDVVLEARNTTVTPVYNAVGAVINAESTFREAALTSDAAIRNDPFDRDVAQEALTQLQGQITAIGTAKATYDERVLAAKEYLGRAPWNLQNGSTEFQAMDTQTVALQALQDAAQQEFTRQQNLFNAIDAMQIYTEHVDEFNEAHTAVTDGHAIDSIPAFHDALVTMANVFAADDEPDEATMGTAFGVARGVKTAVGIRVDALATEDILKTQATETKIALTNASYDRMAAAIDPALVTRLEQRRDVDIKWTQQQIQFEQLKSYAQQAVAARKALVTTPPNFVVAQNALDIAFTGHADYTVAATQDAIRDAETAVDAFQEIVEAATAAYTAYEPAATAAINMLNAAPPHGLDLPDRAALIQTRLAALKTARDTANADLDRLKAAEIAKLVARDNAVYTDKEGAIDAAKTEFTKALKEHKDALAEDPTTAGHDARLTTAKADLKTKRAEFVAAINAYHTIARHIETRLRALGPDGLTEADKIKTKYENLLKETADDVTASLTGLHDEADRAITAVGAVVVQLDDSILVDGANMSIRTVVNGIRGMPTADARQDEALLKRRKALYKHLNEQTKEVEFQKAQQAYNDYIAKADAALLELQAAGVGADQEPRKGIIAQKAVLKAAMDAKIANRQAVVQALANKVQTTIIEPRLMLIQDLDVEIIALEQKCFELELKIKTNTATGAERTEHAAEKKKLGEKQAEREGYIQALAQDLSGMTNFGNLQKLVDHLSYLQKQNATLAHRTEELKYEQKLYTHYATEAKTALNELQGLKTAYDTAAAAPGYATSKEGKEKAHEITLKKAAVQGAYTGARDHLAKAEAIQKKIGEISTALEKETDELLRASLDATNAIKTPINAVKDKINANNTTAQAVDVTAAKIERATLETDIKKAGVHVPDAPKAIDLKTAIPINDFYQFLLAQKKASEAGIAPIAKKLENGEELTPSELQTLTGNKDGTVSLADISDTKIGKCAFELRDDGALIGKADNEFRLKFSGDENGTSCNIQTLSGGASSKEKKFEAGVEQAMTCLKKAGCRLVCIENVKYADDRIPMIRKALNLGQLVAMEEDKKYYLFKRDSSEGARMWNAYRILVEPKTAPVNLLADKYINLLLQTENRQFLEQFLDGVIERGNCEDFEISDTEKGVIIYRGQDGTDLEKQYTKKELMYLASSNDPAEVKEFKEVLHAQALRNDFSKDREYLKLPERGMIANLRTRGADIRGRLGI